MLLCATVSVLAFVSPRAFVGPSLVSLPRPLLVAHDGHLRAHRAAALFTRHQGCRLSAGTGPVPESDEDTTCPADGPGMLELARFTLPTLSALLSSEVMSVIDTAVVGASSSKELAALGPAIMLTDSSAYLFFWLNVACTNLVASALAKDDAEEAFKSVSDTLWCGAFIGVAMSVALFFFGPAALMALTRKAPETLAPATTYLKIRLLTLPALILTMVLQAACTGSKDAVAPLIAVVAGGLLNLFGDILLVSKLHWGIAGAAIATCVSQAVQLGLLWRIVWRKRAAFGVKGGTASPTPHPTPHPHPSPSPSPNPHPHPHPNPNPNPNSNPNSNPNQAFCSGRRGRSASSSSSPSRGPSSSCSSARSA